MKVLLLGFNEKVPYKHDLTELARLVHKALVDNGLEPSTTDLFSDKEFLKLCEHLNKFQIGGRYPPKDMAGWAYSLNLLAFLDEFVVQCRSMVDLERGTPNMVAELLSQDTKDNSVMAAAVTAVLDNNRQVDALINPLL